MRRRHPDGHQTMVGSKTLIETDSIKSAQRLANASAERQCVAFVGEGGSGVRTHREIAKDVYLDRARGLAIGREDNGLRRIAKEVRNALIRNTSGDPIVVSISGPTFTKDEDLIQSVLDSLHKEILEKRSTTYRPLFYVVPFIIVAFLVYATGTQEPEAVVVIALPALAFVLTAIAYLYSNTPEYRAAARLRRDLQGPINAGVETEANLNRIRAVVRWAFPLRNAVNTKIEPLPYDTTKSLEGLIEAIRTPIVIEIKDCSHRFNDAATCRDALDMLRDALPSSSQVLLLASGPTRGYFPRTWEIVSIDRFSPDQMQEFLTQRGLNGLSPELDNLTYVISGGSPRHAIAAAREIQKACEQLQVLQERQYGAVEVLSMLARHEHTVLLNEVGRDENMTPHEKEGIARMALKSVIGFPALNGFPGDELETMAIESHAVEKFACTFYAYATLARLPDIAPQKAGSVGEALLHIDRSPYHSWQAVSAVREDCGLTTCCFLGSKSDRTPR